MDPIGTRPDAINGGVCGKPGPQKFIGGLAYRASACPPFVPGHFEEAGFASFQSQLGFKFYDHFLWAPGLATPLSRLTCRVESSRSSRSWRTTPSTLTPFGGIVIHSIS